MNLIRSLIFLMVLALIGIATYIYLGVYDVAADAPHSAFVYNVLELTRQRSIAARAAEIKVPSLEDSALINAGAEHYREMCSGCHLAPGAADSELRSGLYPKPPNLTQPLNVTPAELFWAIKHGIKMSAMPAWGVSHDDQAIWSIVAFVRKLPGMTAAQYEDLTAAGQGATSHHHHDGPAGLPGHDDAADQHDEPGEHANGDATGTAPGAGDGSQPPETPLSLEGLKPNAVPDAEQVAQAFHKTLAAGDREALLALLSADVTVTEGGHTQSREQYASGHLDQDIAFYKDARVVPLSIASMLTGDAALVGSDSEIRTGGDSQPKVQRKRELLTLKRENGTWKIVAVRWQSLAPETPDRAANVHEHQ